MRGLLAERPRLRTATEPILKAGAAVMAEFHCRHRIVLETVRGDTLYGRLMSVPGVEPITARAFKTGSTPHSASSSRRP